MEESIWSLAQQSRCLQEMRMDIRGFWNDEAARDLNGRYLDPHEIDSQQMLSALEQQKNAIEQAGVKLETAQTYQRQADECAMVVMDKLKFVEQDVTSAFSVYDLYVKYDSDARSKLPRVYELIYNANNACG